ncbi:hypothetical protein RRG08_007536 [Elysia crispata]|uniref:Uncharacterized protein n=1 Tax=Elysia crispata TaxID=231223 RepID=A0AAE0YF94_9GAST|nr:hypothetical protein RRG08_007536 [Elysia crispata]
MRCLQKATVSRFLGLFHQASSVPQRAHALVKAEVCFWSFIPKVISNPRLVSALIVGQQRPAFFAYDIWTLPSSLWFSMHIYIGVIEPWHDRHLPSFQTIFATNTVVE